LCVFVFFAGFYFVFLVPVKRLAGKSISEMTLTQSYTMYVSLGGCLPDVFFCQ